MTEPNATTCARGCCASQREHYKSLSVSSSARAELTKTTTDDHGTHSVEVTQHWQDRQDVTVKPKTLGIKVGFTPQEQ